MEEKYEKSIEEFKKYLKEFDLKDDKISLKYYHTFRVADYAKQLAESENSNEQDTYIAYLCGLLHDIGRFKQATEFSTFIDFKSFDHGDMGYLILKENNYISKYIQDKESQEIILKAVKNHNKFAIADGLNYRELFFAKLIRDADKIDILDKQYNEILDNSTTVDDDVMQTFIAHRLFKRDGTKRNDATEIVKNLCLVFDLNFEKSFEIIEEKGILRKKVEALEKVLDEKNIGIIKKENLLC